MSEHLRALVVILVFAIAVFALAGPSYRAMAVAAGEFERRRNLWLGITLAAFLAHNFWLFVFLAGVLLHIASAKDQNKLGLVSFVLLAVPPFSSTIPGFAGIQVIFDLNYVRLISLVVLLPALVREAATHSGRYFLTETPDKIFYLYVMLNVILMARADISTVTVRSILLLFIDAVIFYAIASRAAKAISVFQSIFASYVIGAAILALVGAFEFARDWLLYSSLDDALGVDRGSNDYVRRGDRLRAVATSGAQSIAYGYMMAVGLLLLLGLRRRFPRKIVWWAGIGILVMGLVSAYSRGPWVGALAGFVVFCLTGPDKWKNLARLVLCSIVLFAVLIGTPLGEALLYRVTIESETFEYRERLLTNALETIAANPFFGSNDFMYTAEMQDLIQGSGIIDLVNTYVIVALKSGLVGLLLFAGFFLSALTGTWRRMISTGKNNSETIDVGRSLLAVLTCILVTIATVSPMSFIPTIYYVFAGLAVAYARLEHEKSRSNAAA